MAHEYINIDQPEITGRHRSTIINGIQEFVEQEYNAETSQINLNAWKTRFDVDIHTESELETLIESVNALLTDTNIENAYLYWEAIPSKYSNDESYDGYHSIGKWGEKWTQFAESQYPIRAFKVKVVVER